MYDIWTFLMQTLTVSSVAFVLLVVKAMFRDKLSPKWQFAIWGILGGALLIPAGSFKRYILINWALIIEIVKTMVFGEYTLTKVVFPFPMPITAVPRTGMEWLFVFYEAGVLFFVVRYVLSYIKLRRILEEGTEPGIYIKAKINEVAGKYELPVCEAVQVEGISSAFVCGIFYPILVLPMEKEIDDKILMHELLHLKYKDTVWGIAIALFRCIHWCNPFIWFCADQVGNDIETLCDYRVLTLLEGEERRDYGRILLAMANEKYARMPGTSSMANGGKNISKRIAGIVRFKKYPSGMKLVSVCIAIVLTVVLLSGVDAQGAYGGNNQFPQKIEHALSMASARLAYCTTPAGALDTYGKALLTGNGSYRAICAPADIQEELAEEIWEKRDESPNWDSGLVCAPDKSKGYAVLNMKKNGVDSYSALIVISLAYPPDGQPAEENMIWLATQQVNVRKEEYRWVVVPENEFTLIETLDTDLNWGSDDLPAYIYSAVWEDFSVEVYYQQIFLIENTGDTVPMPDAEFESVRWFQRGACIYNGDEEKKEKFYQIGLSVAPMENPDKRPQLNRVGGGYSGGSSSDGNSWGSCILQEEWDSYLELSGGGSSSEFAYDDIQNLIPAYYAADLYVNEECVAEMILQLQEGDIYE